MEEDGNKEIVIMQRNDQGKLGDELEIGENEETGKDNDLEIVNIEEQDEEEGSDKNEEEEDKKEKGDQEKIIKEGEG